MTEELASTYVAPLACKQWTYFLKICIRFVRSANTHCTVATPAHGKPNFVGFCTNAKGLYCVQFGRVFMLKSVFLNCAPDFSVKNNVHIYHGLSYVCRKLIYYAPRMRHTRVARCMHDTVVCTGLKRGCFCYWCFW